MTFRAFLENLNARGMFRIRPSLDRIVRVLEALGNPQDRYPSIHIAGTNGKGSVAAALESVLRACGYRTGLYTSPHLFDLRERIQVDGAPVTTDFTACASDVLEAEKKARAPLTYFEFLTAIAFQAFARRKIDIGIVECGLGGLWDATNVLTQPLASVITSIGLDHREWLGETEGAIAAQKSGIIKPRGYAISGVRGVGRDVIRKAARRKNATLEQLGLDFDVEGLTSSLRSGKQTLRFRHKGETPDIVPFGLLGAHQVANAALVMAVLRRLRRAGWSIPPTRRDRGLSSVRWPGRLQILRRPDTATLLFDGAHNPPAMKELLAFIQSSTFKEVPKAFVFSAFKDKDYNAMARMIRPLADHVYLCPLAGPRGAPLRRLRSAFSTAGSSPHVFHSPQEALAQALRQTPRQGLVIVTGSLALVGQLLHVQRHDRFAPIMEKEKSHV